MKPPRAAACCAAAGLLLLFVVTGFSRSLPEHALAADPGRVQTAAAKPGRFGHESGAHGPGDPFYRQSAPASRQDCVRVPQCRVRLIDEVQLASEQTGILDALAVEGSLVRAGSVVARIRDDLLRASLAIVEKEAANDVEVRFARKASEFSQLKYLRALDANRAAPGTVSELDLYELRLAAERSLQQIELAEHQFAMAGLKRDETRTLLERYTVEAPFDAFVREVYKKPGEVVREGEPILALVNTGRIRVEGYLPLEELDLVRLGQFVEIVCHDRRTAGADAFGVAGADDLGSPRSPAGAPLRSAPATHRSAPATRPVVCEGRLVFVDVKVEPVSGKVRVWAEALNRDNLLRDGMTAAMIIHCDTHPTTHHSPLTTHQSP